jgi:hypothetical protein
MTAGPGRDLFVAEIPYASGSVRFRYARYLAEAGDRWVRHGPFLAYHPDGTPASRGTYDHGREQGAWQDFHPNGQLAAEGAYDKGEKVGAWRYWLADGTPQE